MSVQVETLEKNMAKLTVTVSADKFKKAIQNAYEANKGSIRVPGFRKGKVPKMMIERMYGKEVFYDDAAREIINSEYPDAADESGLDIVSRPSIEITQIEDGMDLIFTAEVAVKPEVKLGQYKGLTVTKGDTTVTEEDVAAELENTRNMQARSIEVTDRAIQEGDTAVIDFEGFVDGQPFEGGKAENHSLEIGSHSFIDTFEDQLIGKNPGDELDVNVTFPEEYHAAELAGKPAVFKVKIHSIKAKELPELDDEFASMVSEFDTLEEYKEDIRQKLEERKKNAARRVQEDEAVSQIVEAAEMDIPDPMVDLQCESVLSEFSNRLAQQGMNIQQYMQFSGMNEEQLRTQVRPEALQRIQNSLVLEQIVKEENVEVSEEEIDQEIERMAGLYGMNVENLKEHMMEGEREQIRNDLQIKKALDIVIESAVEQEKPKEEEATEE